MMITSLGEEGTGLCACPAVLFVYSACVKALRKRLRIRSVISVNYHYITVLCPFNLLIRFKCYNTL